MYKDAATTTLTASTVQQVDKTIWLLCIKMLKLPSLRLQEFSFTSLLVLWELALFRPVERTWLVWPFLRTKRRKYTAQRTSRGIMICYWFYKKKAFVNLVAWYIEEKVWLESTISDTNVMSAIFRIELLAILRKEHFGETKTKNNN